MTKFIDFFALSLVRALIFCMRWLPRPIGFLIARLIVGTLRLCMPRLSTVARQNLLMIFPEKSSDERGEILDDSFKNLSRTIFDVAQVREMDPDWVEANCDTKQLREVIARVRAKHGDKGLLIGAAHFGSFELLFQAYAFIDRPISILARGFGLPQLDRWWTARREFHGHRVFARTGGHKEIVSRLRSGEDVAVLFDQNVKRKHAAFVDFFGIPAATSRSLGLAALQTGCPIVFIAAAEISPGRYRFFAEEIRNPKDELGSVKQKVSRVIERLHAPLERVIGAYPEQWFWIHRRFKTRPLGEPETVYLKTR